MDSKMQSGIKGDNVMCVRMVRDETEDISVEDTTAQI